ncbi:hypothetical protein CDAR_541471 [Caerostris darwini]|uniref:Uncharacterized protein n=1 Tax=Caerostris darwini TaxID=1538125 RepID=A0AAV4VVH3_9ARAC|nr:hypothetical protein CDAR_541471 [Caerostris darwini]
MWKYSGSRILDYKEKRKFKSFFEIERMFDIYNMAPRFSFHKNLLLRDSSSLKPQPSLSIEIAPKSGKAIKAIFFHM